MTIKSNKIQINKKSIRKHILLFLSLFGIVCIFNGCYEILWGNLLALFATIVIFFATISIGTSSKKIQKRSDVEFSRIDSES